MKGRSRFNKIMICLFILVGVVSGVVGIIHHTINIKYRPEIIEAAEYLNKSWAKAGNIDLIDTDEKTVNIILDTNMTILEYSFYYGMWVNAEDLAKRSQLDEESQKKLEEFREKSQEIIEYNNYLKEINSETLFALPVLDYVINNKTELYIFDDNTSFDNLSEYLESQETSDRTQIIIERSASLISQNINEIPVNKLLFLGVVENFGMLVLVIVVTVLLVILLIEKLVINSGRKRVAQKENIYSKNEIK